MDKCENCLNKAECTGDGNKSFALNPRSKIPNDAYASASRLAMRVYSKAIRHKDPELADKLYVWAINETLNAFKGGEANEF